MEVPGERERELTEKRTHEFESTEMVISQLRIEMTCTTVGVAVNACVSERSAQE